MVFDILNKKKQVAEEQRIRRRNAVILDQATLQRSKLHIKFNQDITNITGVTGTLMAMNDTALVIELSGISTMPEYFIGQPISCFLKIIEPEGKHREIFYTFTTTILRIRFHPERLLQLAVSFPDSIQGTQRRKSLRMKPDLNQFSHLAIWRYDAKGGFDIANPTINLNHFKHNLAALENISGGGLRLLIRRPVLKEQTLDPHKGDRFIMFMTFSASAQKLRSEYWLVCKNNNVQLDPVSGDVTLGLEFIANGVRNNATDKVEWSKITDNVIDDLAQRVYQWHLSLYRDKGLT
jgi:hypothetical protein